MNEMMKNAATNLADTAGNWNDARKSGNTESERLWNKIYAEKTALLKAMGFNVIPETDEDGYAIAITVGGTRETVHGLFR